MDYSDWETDDGEPGEEEPPVKGKRAAAKGKKASPKEKEGPQEPRKVIKAGQPLRRSTSSAGQKGKQGSLMNFFGKNS